MRFRNRVILLCGLLGLALSTFVSCKKDPDPDAAQSVIAFHVPQGWPQPAYRFENNPLSKNGFELGRRLFYDARLSKDNSISCGSCHQSFAAFANADHIVSHGIDGRLGNRNSPGLANLAWNTSFFWDGGVNHIELQPIAPITNPVEMDVTLDTIIARLQADAAMRGRFLDAFGTEDVTTQRIMRALAQFMGMMISANSRYDQYSRGEEGASLSESELRGQTVFQNTCAGCHQPPLFTDHSFRNNGLPPTAVNDSGRAHITHAPEDLYKFRVPSLRNLKFTGPYMHDGRFATLDAVLDHYTTGIHASATLDPALSSGVALTAQQRADLLDFLNTLNDDGFAADVRFTEVH